MNYRSPLAKVIGLGSAKEGSGHWWHQRLTSIALVPLTLWFTYSVATHLTGACIEEFPTWIGTPVNSALLIAFVVALFYHTQLGIQVVLEDYVHHEGLKITAILAVKALSFILVVMSIISILQFYFTGISR